MDRLAYVDPPDQLNGGADRFDPVQPDRINPVDRQPSLWSNP